MVARLVVVGSERKPNLPVHVIILLFSLASASASAQAAHDPLQVVSESSLKGAAPAIMSSDLPVIAGQLPVELTPTRTDSWTEHRLFAITTTTTTTTSDWLALESAICSGSSAAPTFARANNLRRLYANKRRFFSRLFAQSQVSVSTTSYGARPPPMRACARAARPTRGLIGYADIPVRRSKVIGGESQVRPAANISSSARPHLTNRPGDARASKWLTRTEPQMWAPSHWCTSARARQPARLEVDFGFHPKPTTTQVQLCDFHRIT